MTRSPVAQQAAAPFVTSWGSNPCRTTSHAPVSAHLRPGASAPRPSEIGPRTAVGSVLTCPSASRRSTHAGHNRPSCSRRAPISSIATGRGPLQGIEKVRLRDVPTFFRFGRHILVAAPRGRSPRSACRSSRPSSGAGFSTSRSSSSTRHPLRLHHGSRTLRHHRLVIAAPPPQRAARSTRSTTTTFPCSRRRPARQLDSA